MKRRAFFAGLVAAMTVPLWGRGDERAKWREAVEYYRLKAAHYRSLMGWQSPELDGDAPALPDGSTPDWPRGNPRDFR